MDKFDAISIYKRILDTCLERSELDTPDHVFYINKSLELVGRLELRTSVEEPEQDKTDYLKVKIKDLDVLITARLYRLIDFKYCGINTTTSEEQNIIHECEQNLMNIICHDSIASGLWFQLITSTYFNLDILLTFKNVTNSNELELYNRHTVSEKTTKLLPVGDAYFTEIDKLDPTDFTYVYKVMFEDENITGFRYNEFRERAIDLSNERKGLHSAEYIFEKLYNYDYSQFKIKLQKYSNVNI